MITATPKHEAAYADLCKLLDKHKDEVTPLELLAIASNMVGKLVALQDQKKVTPNEAMRVVSRNIEIGNRQAIDGLMKSKGNA